MAVTKSQFAQQRLREVNRSHEAKHAAAHREFRVAFDKALARHGLDVNFTPKTLHLVHELPLAFYEDEEFLTAKAKLMEDLGKATQGRHDHVSKLPYANVRFVRAN